MDTVAVLAMNGLVALDAAIPCDLFGRVRLPDPAREYCVRACGESPEVRAGAYNIRAPWTLADLVQADTVARQTIVPETRGRSPLMVDAKNRIARWMRERLFEPLRRSGDPAKRLKAMLETYDEMYDGGRDVCLLGTLVLGGSRARFQRRLKEIFEAWITALAGLALDAGVPAKTARERAEDAVLRIQGALILAGGLDDTAPFRRTIKTLAKKFLA